MSDTPTFHDALIQALCQAHDAHAGVLIKGWHQAGLLDLRQPDSEGQSVLDAILSKRPLGPETMRALIGTGASGLFTEPGANGKSPLDRQLQWLNAPQSWGGQQDRHALAEGLAAMIACSDPAWWEALDQDGDDPGARLSSTLANYDWVGLPGLVALWQRGVSTQARLNGSARCLACGSLQSIEGLQAYRAAGGDLLAPITLPHSSPGDMPLPAGWPLWQQAGLANEEVLPFLTEKAQAGALPAGDVAMVVQLGQLEETCDASQQAHLSEMAQLPKWQTARFATGEPWWMLALSKCADISLFLHQVAPCVVERDNLGRSGWFWLMQNSKNLSEPAIAQMQTLQPIDAFGADTAGRGLLVQLIDHDIDKLQGARFTWTGLNRLDCAPEALFQGVEHLDFGGVFARAVSAAHSNEPRHLLQLEGLFQRATPVQRGHLLGGALVGLSAGASDIHVARLERWLGPDTVSGAIQWPEVSVAQMNQLRQVAKGHAVRLVNIPALLDRWQVEIDGVGLSSATVARGSKTRSGPRL